MDRRTVLSGILGSGLLVLGGCTRGGDSTPPERDHDVGRAPVAALKMEAVSDLDIAKRVTYRIDLPHRTRERKFVEFILQEQSSTITASAQPVPEDRPFVIDSRIYRLSAKVQDTFEATTYRLSLTAVDTAASESNVISFDELPAVDKHVLERYGWDDGGPFELSNVEVAYRHDAESASVFVPELEYTYIQWDSGTTAKLVVDPGSETQLTTYHYTIQEVRADAAAFGRSIRQENAFELRDLSAEQQTIVTTAIQSEDGYEIETGKPSRALTELRERFGDKPQVRKVYRESDRADTDSGIYLTRYDESLYWTTLQVSTQTGTTEE